MSERRLAYSENERITMELELAENLRKARELLNRIGHSRRLVEPDSYGERHLLEHGHVLRFGCCRDAAAIGRPAEPSVQTP